MSAFGFGLLTFVCTFGGALAGIWVRARLPAAHLSKESQDVIRLGMGLVATMTALLLGLVTAAAKGSFDSQDAAVRNAAAGLLTMDRMLARYGPETQVPRDLLQRIVAARVEETWPTSTARANDPALPQGALPAEAVEDQILRLTPETDAQRWLKVSRRLFRGRLLRGRRGLPDLRAGRPLRRPHQDLERALPPGADEPGPVIGVHRVSRRAGSRPEARTPSLLTTSATSRRWSLWRRQAASPAQRP